VIYRDAAIACVRAAGILTAPFVCALAIGQTIDVERPRTLVVGMPSVGARTDRIDPSRTGHVRAMLPHSDLRTEWRVSLGEPVQRGPLVDARGVTYVVGTHGDVLAISRDGTEKWRASTGTRQPGPAVLLSDDTFVFVDSGGDVVALREGTARWRARLGEKDGENRDYPAPLPLRDGGVAVATAHALTVFDAEGHERARAEMIEETSVPLLAALGRVVVVGSSGAVWAWTPGALELDRIAGFRARISDGAALEDDRTLVGVDGQSRLLALDLLRGTVTTRATAPPGTLLLGPPATRGTATYLLRLTPTNEEVVGVDERGVEVLRTTVGSHVAAVSVDGGPGPVALPPHTAPLVDNDETVAFATTTGAVGTANRTGAALLPFACPQSVPAIPRAPPVAGLAPLGEDAFVAVCSAGMVLAVRGRSAPTQPSQQSGEVGARPL
jgi:PQQ-like domain